MKKTITSLALAFLLLFSLAVPAFAESVVLSAQSMTVDGTPVSCEAYNIDGSNYFKLRDLAYLLNRTGSQFSVDWDAAKATVSITTGKAYTANGSELFKNGDQSSTAVKSTQTILINGKRSSLSAYNIGGSNYFKLRELGSAVGFDVDFNTATNTVVVRSKAAAAAASSARLGETADAGTSYVDKFIFLGDSTTYGLKYYGVLSGGTNTTQVWTPASGTLTLSYQSFAAIVYPDTGEQITISEAIERKKPEYLMITLGVNGVSFMDKDNFVREYTDLVTRVQEKSPDTKIICNSIYPVAASYDLLKDINNDKIRRANAWIEQVAEDTGTRFLNTFEILVGSNGYLPESYHNGDGLHLNTDSFNRVLNYIRTHEYK